MNNLTLAICMYNAEKYIAETLQCIMAQTMQDFHLLIVDDCSTDSSVECVELFFKANPRHYELYQFETNHGIACARQFALTHVSTKYLIFIDADDCPYPSLVEKLYTKISSDNDLMAVGCHLEYMDNKGNKMNGGIFLGESTKEGFYHKAANEKLIFMQPTAIFNRLLALQVGGFKTSGFYEEKPRYQDFCEDLDLWTRMSDLYRDGKAIVVLPEILCRYRKHEKSLSANTFGMILRIRHIKINLKRRRRGKKELSFIEFREQMTTEELKQLEKDAKSADSLRNAYYCLKKGKITQFIKCLSISVFNNPRYIVDKLKYNLLRKK